MTHAPADGPTRRTLSVADYVDGVLAGDRATVARAITLVESRKPAHRAQAQEMLVALLPHAAPGTQLHAAFDVACEGVRRQLLLRKSTDLLLAALALLPALAAALPAEFAAERLPDLLRFAHAAHRHAAGQSRDSSSCLLRVCLL